MRATMLNFSAFFIIFNSVTNAAGIQIVPNGKTITYKDGVTHERTKYLIIPDGSNSYGNSETNLKSNASKISIESTSIEDEENESLNSIDNQIENNRKGLSVKYIKLKNLEKPIKDDISKFISNSEIKTKSEDLRTNSQESSTSSSSTNDNNDLLRNSNVLDIASPSKNDVANPYASAEQIVKNYGYSKHPSVLRFSTEYLNGVFTPEVAEPVGYQEVDPKTEKFDFFRSGAGKSDFYNGLDYTWEPEKLVKNGKPLERYSEDYVDYGKTDGDERYEYEQAKLYNVVGQHEHQNTYSDAAEKYIGEYEPFNLVYRTHGNLCKDPIYNIRDCLSRNQMYYDKYMKNYLSQNLHNDQRVLAFKQANNDVNYILKNNNDIFDGNQIVGKIFTRYPNIGTIKAKARYDYENNDRNLNHVLAKQPRVYSPGNQYSKLFGNKYFSNVNNQYDYLQKINSYKNSNHNPVIPGYVVDIPSVGVYNGQINNLYKNLINQKINKVILNRNDKLFNNFKKIQINKIYDSEGTTESIPNKIAINVADSIFITDIIRYINNIIQEKYGINVKYINYNSLNVNNIYKIEVKYNLKNLRDFLTKVIALPRADTVENVDLLYNNILKFIHYLDSIGTSESHVFKLIEVIKKRILTML